ncbi:uncharacterized protein DUF4239 [Plasticicumulans lactativorans]|uniref:Uncharacterized protein DUF4239 n=1 Tax=Plasticicumulans lactativorans TaxID=1133106 RepID=A0A4R2LBK5_9GAMM|nr:DUF4239 domain-containing protein [Plasticicumulans lactativorans]TCO81768.1 uncharacterized protein DUF4239 [Plasticicumulans lactativorans]
MTNLTLYASLAAAGVLLGMLVCLEVGRRLGRVRLAHDPDGLAQGVGTAEGAVFGLLGLLIAFTFSGAATRFEERRHLITQETNAIGTAYLRLDLLPGDAQADLRALFRRYVELRAAVFRSAADQAATQAKLTESAALQNAIWGQAMAACRRPDTPAPAAILLLPALNEMFDITTTRWAATRNHPPIPIFVLLAGLSCIAALLVGYDMAASRKRSLLHSLAFATILSLSLYVILDLEFPRLGMIRIDAADQLLLDMLEGMH